MKKLVYVTIALVALFAANSCKNKNNVPVISAADSVEVEDAMNDSTIYGVCGEGTSMHSLELISDDGDTLSVFIDDENPDVVQGGLLAGDRIALIGYKAEERFLRLQNDLHILLATSRYLQEQIRFDIPFPA